ncbi:MAG: helix-turn-helix transcriptional regulator [Clostridia bacterium]|nr:helix-turn-helix transcriptional regulator [Clostridia bacterium]
MNENYENTFAEKIRILRKKSGLTQNAFGARVHLSRSCIANYEAGRRFPGVEVAEYIAICFGMDAEYFSEEAHA